MARGKSGRIVLEIDPNIKRKLYLALENNQLTLKDWFVENAESYISSNSPYANRENSVAEENKHSSEVDKE